MLCENKKKKNFLIFYLSKIKNEKEVKRETFTIKKALMVGYISESK